MPGDSRGIRTSPPTVPAEVQPLSVEGEFGPGRQDGGVAVVIDVVAQVREQSPPGPHPRRRRQCLGDVEMGGMGTKAQPVDEKRIEILQALFGFRGNVTAIGEIGKRTEAIPEGSAPAVNQGERLHSSGRKG